MPYQIEEPPEVSGYRDKNGKFWDTRADALKQNFKIELAAAISATYQGTEGRPPPVRFVIKFIKDNPDLVRMIINRDV